MPPPERRYFAVELSAERRFAESWMLFAAYTWAHSYGNYEGLVNSDFGTPLSGFQPSFDGSLYMENSNGDLPNDRRHSLKLHGAYAWNSGFQLGGTLFYRTGRPVNSFGFHPDIPPWEHSQYAFYTGGEPTPRGSMGRTDDVWALGLTARYSWSWGKTELDARVDVFNLFNNQAVVEVEEQSEFFDGYSILPNPDYGATSFYQNPRSVRFGVGLSF